MVRVDDSDLDEDEEDDIEVEPVDISKPFTKSRKQSRR